MEASRDPDSASHGSRSSDAYSLAVMAAIVGATAWGAFRSRDAYWSWLFPASLSLGVVVTASMRLLVVRRHAHDLIMWCRFLIVVVTALVGLSSGSPVFAVRLFMALVGPGMVLYMAQSVIRFDELLEAQSRRAEQLKTSAHILQALNALLEVQQAQVAAEVPVFERLMKTSRRPRRVAGRRRR